MENVIGNLLEDCHVTQARWLANLFNHSSLELDVVMVTYYPIYNGITITSNYLFSSATLMAPFQTCYANHFVTFFRINNCPEKIVEPSPNRVPSYSRVLLMLSMNCVQSNHA